MIKKVKVAFKLKDPKGVISFYLYFYLVVRFKEIYCRIEEPRLSPILTFFLKKQVYITRNVDCKMICFLRTLTQNEGLFLRRHQSTIMTASLSDTPT